MRAFLLGIIATLLLTSCATLRPLTPEERAAHFGKEPSGSEIAALLTDYCTRNNLVVFVPKDSIRRQPSLCSIVPAFMEPITLSVEQDEAEWPKQEPSYLLKLVTTSGYPPANATEVGYHVTLTEMWESSAGKMVGKIEYRFFISDGVIKTFEYKEKGDVHLVREKR